MTYLQDLFQQRRDLTRSMKNRGLRVTCPMNGGLSAEEFSANVRREHLNDLIRAEQAKQGPPKPAPRKCDHCRKRVAKHDLGDGVLVCDACNREYHASIARFRADVAAGLIT